MGYLICDNCKGYYKLQPGESAADFNDKCDCGGTIRYAENIDIVDPNWKQAPISDICPKCGANNPDGATFCASCGSNMKPETNKRAAVKPQGGNKKSNKQNKTPTDRGKILIAVVGIIIFIGIIAAVISAFNQPTFEDKLIDGYQSGASQPVLEDYIAAHTRALTVSLQKNTKDANVLAAELQNVKAIETFQTMYIHGQITAKDLKEKTYPLYQQYNDLKDLIHLTGS